MGVGGPTWEIQWHPASGRAVRRFTLNRRGLVGLACAGTAAALLLVGVAAVLGFGIWGLFHRLNLDTHRQDNHRLRVEGHELREELAVRGRQAVTLLGRGHRLAWVMGTASQTPGLFDPPPTAGTDEEQIRWLQAATTRLEEVGRRLAEGAADPPMPIGSLPTGAPLEPVQAVPVALYGRRISPFTGKEESHHGVTWAAPAGEPVVAAGAGRVVWAGPVRERRANEWTRYGVLVVVEHSAGVYSVYGHMSAVTVRRGQQVVRGQPLGEVGQTGWARTPGLYWEVRWPVGGVSRPIDPALVNLTLPLEDVSGRISNPVGDLDGGFAGIERLVRPR